MPKFTLKAYVTKIYDITVVAPSADVVKKWAEKERDRGQYFEDLDPADGTVEDTKFRLREMTPEEAAQWDGDVHLNEEGEELEDADQADE